MPKPDCTDRYSNVQESDVRSKEFEYTWKINNFSFLHQGMGKFIRTEGKVDNQKVWIIDFYADGYNDGEHLATQVKFDRKLLNLEYPAYKIIICIIDKNGKEHEMYKGTNTLIARLIKKNYVLDDKNEYLSNDSLTLKYKIFYTSKVIHKSTCINLPSNQQKFNSLENIFNKEIFSDVRIITDQKVFYVYKGILTNQSSVFAAMFEHDMQENQHNSVNITDFGHEVIQEVLYFIYSGKVNNIKNIARDLFIAADKYDLLQLRLICEESLIEDLNVETVISLLIFAEKYGAKILKESALSFFKLNAKEVIQDEQYKIHFNNLVCIMPEIIQSLML